MGMIIMTTLNNVTGYLQDAEATQLIKLAIGKTILEVGSFKGLSASLMAKVAARVSCVDTFMAHDNGKDQTQEVRTLDEFKRAVSPFSNVTWFVGTSEQAATSPDGPQGQFDMIFIDAMHTYDACSQDIELWWPRLKPGGIMAFHDYGHTLNKDGSVAGGFPGVTQAVNEKFGVPQNVVCSLAWVTKPL